MKKFGFLALMIAFCLVVPSSVLASEARDLVEWDRVVSSSDPPETGTLDGMDPGNPNASADVGSLKTWVDGTTGNLICKITNGYPGYQANIAATIINITNFPVVITGVEFIGKPDEILVRLTDENGNEDFVGMVIDGGDRLGVNLVNRVRQTAKQDTTYEFEIKITVRQDRDRRDRPDPPDPPEERDDLEEIVVPEEPPVLEPMVVPEEPPVRELPFTGGDIAFFVCTGLVLGGLGVMLRRRL